MGTSYQGTAPERLGEDGQAARREPRGSLPGAYPPFTTHHPSPTLFLLAPSGSHYTPAHGWGRGGQMDRRGLSAPGPAALGPEEMKGGSGMQID